MLQKLNHRQRKEETWISCHNQMMLRCHPLPCQRLGDGQHGNGNNHHKMVQQQKQLDQEGAGSPGKRSAERSNDWSCGSLSGIMVVGWQRVPNAILVVVMLAVGDVLCITHCHLLATVPRNEKRSIGKGSATLVSCQESCDKPPSVAAVTRSNLFNIQQTFFCTLLNSQWTVLKNSIKIDGGEPEMCSFFIPCIIIIPPHRRLAPTLPTMHLRCQKFIKMFG